MPPRKKDAPEITIKKFYAPWCDACSALNTELEKVKQKRPNLLIEEINTDDEPNLASMHGVRALPTLMFVHDDGTNDIFIGPKNADAVIQWLKKVAE